MWQEIVVGILVAVSAAFIVRRFWKSFMSHKKAESSCSCGCSRCGAAGTKMDCEGRL
jgi:hypothetical protein